MKVSISPFLFFCALHVSSVRAEAQPFLFFPTEADKPVTCHFCGYYYKSGNCHGAIDIDVDDDGTSIYAAAAGEVVEVAKEKKSCKKQPYGVHVKLRHTNGYTTLYGHMKVGTVSLNQGDWVEVGQQIGIGDNSGCSDGSHLHFEIRDPDDVRVDPFDAPWNHHKCVPYSTAPKDCGDNPLWIQCPPVPYHEAAANQDADGDGFTIGDGDCDDSSPFVNPAYPESCDYIDNDCDGETDEDWPERGTVCSDGVGECYTVGTFECNIPWNSLICTATPGEPALETCDGLDNDCDGATDEQPESLISCSALIGAAGPCQDVVCDEGACALSLKFDGTYCSDADVCNGQEVCKNGMCVPGESLDCDDGLDCTTDACDSQAGCVHEVKPEYHSLCDDGNPCRVGAMNETCTCVYTPTQAPCQFDKCYEVGQCDGTYEWNCLQWTPVECDDKLFCTIDSCDFETGCVHTPDSVACDDADSCTIDICEPDPNSQYAGCHHNAIPAGTPCDPGKCFLSGICGPSYTGCAGSDPVDCDDEDPCTTDGCVWFSGCTHKIILGCP